MQNTQCEEREKESEPDMAGMLGWPAQQVLTDYFFASLVARESVAWYFST